MKKIIVVLITLLSVTSASSVWARGYDYRHYGGYHSGRSYHHDRGFGIAAGVVGGLLLGSAILSAAAPPPPTVVYEYPQTRYEPQVVVQRPRLCVEERKVYGEWQTSRYDGRQVWVSFRHPVTESVEVPCY